MKKSVRIGRWPFERGEQVTLHWLRSPWQNVLSSNQWQMTGVFRTKAGETKEIDLPWGMLPLLRLGQVYRDGQLIENPINDVVNLSLPQAVSINIVEMRRAVSPELYYLEGEANLSQRCLIVESVALKLIIPVLECIRALLVPNKAFAYGLLEPNYLERVITRSEVVDNCLNISFSKDIARNSLTESLASFVARLVHDSSFRASWDSIYYKRFGISSRSDWSTEVPLSIRIPNLTQFWSVRGIGKGREMFVFEILEVEPSESLPFSKIQITHPHIRKRRAERESLGKPRPRQKSSAGYEVDPSAASPVASSFPLVIATAQLAVVEEQSFEVKTVAQVSGFYTKRAPAEEALIDQSVAPEGSREEQVVTLSGDGVGGQISSAEVSAQPPLQIMANSDDGLDEFADAINAFQAAYPQVCVKWEVRTIVKEISFAICEGTTRKYALVRLEWKGEGSCWILEIGRPDDYKISTLLFSVAEEEVVVSEEATKFRYEIVVDRLIGEALISHGGWRGSTVEAIAKSENSAMSWLKHIDKVAEDWSERLYTKGRKVMQLMLNQENLWLG
jgi:hypothetical protein